MRLKRILLLIPIVCLLINACQGTRINEDIMPGIDVPMTEYNQKFEIGIWPGLADVHRDGEVLDFFVDNTSDETIVFGKDFGASIFIKRGDGWEQIENKMGYPNVVNILPPRADDPTGLALSVSPDVGEILEETTVRIIIVGHEKDRPSEQVAGFIDVLYEP